MKKIISIVLIGILTFSGFGISIQATNDNSTPEFFTLNEKEEDHGCNDHYNKNYSLSERLFDRFPVMNEPINVKDLNDINSNYPSIEVSNIDTPDYFNWKDYNGKDWTTPARNQGNCGCCGVFAAIGALESVIKIREDCAELYPDLSEQYVLSCLPDAALVPGEGCSGGMGYKALKLMMETTPEGNNCNGSLFESSFPYQANDDIPCSEKSLDWLEKLVPVLDCGQIAVGFDNQDARETIKSLIMQIGPVAAYMYVPLNPHVFHIWGNTHHSPTDYYPYEERELEVLNHEIVIVGWKDDTSIGNGGYWICKNSWGTNWGYDGFYNIEYGALFTGYLIDWGNYNPESFDWPNDPHPPNTPTITGSTNGKVGFEYEYTLNILDPDNDYIYYTINWDDSVVEKWVGPFASGEIITARHSWDRRGTYNVKVQAMDTWGSQSEWQTLAVRIPRYKPTSLLHWFLDQYPLLFPLLRQILSL